MTCNLRWLLIFVSSMVGLVVCGMLGLLHDLWLADGTRISFLILGLYALVGLFVGWLTWLRPDSAVRRYRAACGFVPELMTGLGMLGTVIGFLQMLGSFQGLDVSNVATTQAAISNLSAGISVAMTTTLVGLACALPMQLQLVNLDIATGEAA